MTTLLLHGIAAGVLVALACGDSGKETATARPAGSQPAGQARAPIDACTLLTEPEAAAILGTAVNAPEPGSSSQCTYTAQSGRGEIILHVLPLQFRSEKELHAFLVEDTRAMNQRMKDGLSGTGATVKETTVDPVPEVGSPAYYVDPTLVVFKDGPVLSIVAADRRQAVAVAAKALPRF